MRLDLMKRKYKVNPDPPPPAAASSAPAATNPQIAPAGDGTVAPPPAGGGGDGSANHPRPSALKRTFALIRKLWKLFVFCIDKLSSKNAALNRLWTLVVMVVVFYNTFLITFRIGFLEQHSLTWLAVDIPADVILWLDICINFVSPYEEGVELVKDRRKTIRRYLHPRKGWFYWDFLASIPLDWLGVWYGFWPAFRLNRLLRLRRTWYYFDRLEEMTASRNFNPSFIRLAKFIFLQVMLSHGAACGYVYIARIEGDLSLDWTRAPAILDPDEDLLLKYMLAMYWSVVMMTGYGGTFPVHDAEVWFSIVIVLVGLASNVTILGTVGSLMTEFDSSGTEFKAKIDSITDYLKYRGIKGDLRKRVRGFYDYLYKSRKGLDETAVLEDLPDFLRVEVALALNREMVEKVNIFEGSEPTFISEVVMHLKPAVAMKGSYIIRAGEIGAEMFFIAKGAVDVVIANGIVVANLKEGNSFGEVALIYDRKRNASIKANTNCDLFVLTKEDFDEIMEAYPEEAKKIRTIAEKRFNSPNK